MLMSLSRWPQRRRPNTTGSRMAPKPILTDVQWDLIKDLFANPSPSPAGGRPRADSRKCFEGIVWVLRQGAHWKELPEQFLLMQPAGVAIGNGPSPARWLKHERKRGHSTLNVDWVRLRFHHAKNIARVTGWIRLSCPQSRKWSSRCFPQRR